MSSNNLELARKARLQGKYLKALDAYLECLDFTTPSTEVVYNVKLDSLVELLANFKSEWISEFQAFSILVGIIYSEIDCNSANSRQARIRTRVVEEFESIPREYNIEFSIPGLVNHADEEINISDSIKVVTKSRPGNQLERAAVAFYAPPAETVLVMASVGYTDNSPDSPIISQCIGTLKLCTFILRETSKMQTNTWLKAPAPARLIDLEMGLAQAIDVPQSINNLFSRISLDYSHYKVFDRDPSRKG